MRNIESLLKNLHSSKPNILLIVSDDRRYGDLSYKEAHEDVNTPSLDRLKNLGCYSREVMSSHLYALNLEMLWELVSN